MESMVRITSNAKDLLPRLKKIEGAMQKVTAATLTSTAEAVTIRSKRNIKKTMIVRAEKWTLGSLRTYKASASRPIARQDAVAGTASDYLPIHDKGGTVKARKKVIAVPTNRVRGADRKKRVGKKYRIDNMPRAFVLKPGPVLKRPALFIRTGKKGKLEKVRDLGGKKYKLKAKMWHSEAVKTYGNYVYMAGVFKREADRFLAGK